MRIQRVTGTVAVAAISAALLVGFAATSAGAAEYVIDRKGSHAFINFRIKHLGFSWLSGRFDNFTGKFSYDEAAPEKSKVRVEIDVASINSNHAERDKHLRNADFLNVSKFPTAVFESTSVTPMGDGKAKVTGNLTLRGVTKEIAFEAQHVGGGKDPWGGYRDGFTGKVSLPLKDFGITHNLGPASQEVELTLDIEGVRQ